MPPVPSTSDSAESVSPKSELSANSVPILQAEGLIYKITENIRDSLDETGILAVLTQSIVEVLAVERCKVELYDAELKTAVVACEYTLGTLACAGQQRQLSQFRELYQPLLQHQPLQFAELQPHWSQQVVRVTWLACPIFDSQSVLGNLWLSKPGEAYFSSEEQQLVQQVANHCAIAIRQARLHQAIQSQVVELVELNQIKDDFLKLVSHELLTPLGSVQLAAQTLEKILTSKADLTSSQRQTALRTLTLMQQACRRQSKLINDLLMLIFPDLRQGVKPILIDLQTWLPSLLRSFTTQIERERFTLTCDLPADLPVIECDSVYLEKILNELLTNALKYTPTGETITLSAAYTPDQLHLVVQNTGVEIPAVDLPYIFEKFYRVPALDERNAGGTGLGLALVTKMLAKLNGHIEVTSQQQTTTFTVTLPVSAMPTPTA